MASAAHRPSYIFLTHCHSDHSYNLPNLVSGRHHTDIFTPSLTAPFVRDYISSSQKLNAHQSDESSFPFADLTIIPVNPGDSFSIGKKQDLLVRVIHVRFYSLLFISFTRSNYNFNNRIILLIIINNNN